MFAISITLAVIILIGSNMVACANFKIQFIYECDFIASPQYLYYKNKIV